MLNNVSFSQLICRTRPVAHAALRGSDQFPNIAGTVLFYPADQGTLVVAEVFNLPQLDPRDMSRVFGPFYAFHLHDGRDCGSGAGHDPFAAAGNHYNPTGALHPNHAGDFPALLGNGGYAYASFYTGRFTPTDTMGKTVVVHQNADDYHTQPSGNAGTKIACGVVYAAVQPL